MAACLAAAVALAAGKAAGKVRYSAFCGGLNDYFGVPEHGLDEMRLRARMARICAPGALVDTDHIGFGDFSYRGGYEFFRRACELGVPSLYLNHEDLKDREFLDILRRLEK